MTSSLDQIRDLAANYSDRQGLRIVPMALMILIQSFPRPLRVPSEAYALAMPLTLLVGLGGYALIGRYYERKFGRVEELPYEGVPVALQIALVVLGFFVSIGIDMLVRPPVFVSGLLVAAWLIATSWSSRRIRGYYAAAGIVLALVSLLPLIGQTQASVASMYGFVFGVSLLLAGVRDHAQFVGQFPRETAVE